MASMWYSTSLTPDASFDYFAWVRVYQTIGLPFLFIPINTVAYDGLPPDKTNQGSALMNVARNLGGSIGISIANVELTQRTPVSSGPAGREHDSVIAGLAVHGAPVDPVLHPARRLAGCGARPGDGIYRTNDRDPGDDHGPMQTSFNSAPLSPPS